MTASVPGILLNGCHNKPRPTPETTYLAQAGYEDPVSQGWGNFSRQAVYIQVPHRMSTTCQYDKSATDPGCVGCVHGGKV